MYSCNIEVCLYFKSIDFSSALSILYIIIQSPAYGKRSPFFAEESSTNIQGLKVSGTLLVRLYKDAGTPVKLLSLI